MLGWCPTSNFGAPSPIANSNHPPCTKFPASIISYHEIGSRNLHRVQDILSSELQQMSPSCIHHHRILSSTRRYRNGPCVVAMQLMESRGTPQDLYMSQPYSPRHQRPPNLQYSCNREDGQPTPELPMSNCSPHARNVLKTTNHKHTKGSDSCNGLI